MFFLKIWIIFSTLAHALYAALFALNWDAILAVETKQFYLLLYWIWMITFALCITSYTVWRLLKFIITINFYISICLQSQEPAESVPFYWLWIGKQIKKIIKQCGSWGRRLLMKFIFLQNLFFYYNISPTDLAFFVRFNILKLKYWIKSCVYITNNLVKKPRFSNRIAQVETIFWLFKKAVFSFSTLQKTDKYIYYHVWIQSNRRRHQWHVKANQVHMFFAIMGMICLGTGIPAILHYRFCFPFLDTSGIDAPHNRTAHFWNSTEFGQRLRQRYWKAEYSYRVMDPELWREKNKAAIDAREEFLKRITQKHWAWKVWETPAYVEKTSWELFYDRAKKIRIFAFCFLSLLLFFNACDNADLGDFGGPAGFFGGDGSG